MRRQYLSKEWNCMGNMSWASLFMAWWSGYGRVSGPLSVVSTGAATRLFRISLTLMPLLDWLMLEMDEAGLRWSTVEGSVKLSCDLASDDSVQNSPLMPFGPPMAWSRSAPFITLDTWSSPSPESEWGRDDSWRDSSSTLTASLRLSEKADGCSEGHISQCRKWI